MNIITDLESLQYIRKRLLRSLVQIRLSITYYKYKYNEFSNLLYKDPNDKGIKLLVDKVSDELNDDKKEMKRIIESITINKQLIKYTKDQLSNSKK